MSGIWICHTLDFLYVGWLLCLPSCPCRIEFFSPYHFIPHRKNEELRNSRGKKSATIRFVVEAHENYSDFANNSCLPECLVYFLV